MSELTRREYFAIKAMSAILCNSKMGDSDLHCTSKEWIKDVTETGVEFADALIKLLDEDLKQ